MEPVVRRSSLTTWIVAAGLLLVLAALAVTGIHASRRASNERNASATLKTIVSAEADFWGNDRDNNGVPDFWTKDVAGLGRLVPAGGREPLRLISAATADADPAHPGAIPRAGFWHEAMDRHSDGTEYRQGPGKDRHPRLFGFLARPADPSTGGSVFYANQDNLIFKEPIELPLRRQWPKDEELRHHGHGPDCCP